MQRCWPWLFLLWSGAAHAADADDDGIVNRKDACPDQAEVVNGYADDDGCPDELGILVVTVKDLAGDPVKGAAVSVGDHAKRTDPYGVATFPELMPGLTYAVQVDHPDYVDEDVQNVIPPQGRHEQVVTLDWKPVPIEVRAVDPRSGQALDAVVRMDGPGFMAPERTGDDGEAVVLLRPGEWALTVYADHHLQARRTFDLEPGGATQEARFELAPSWTGFGDLALPFAAGSAAIERDLQETLDDLIVELFAWSDVRLDVRGHPDAHLEKLSADRAGAVWAWLVEAGVPAGQVRVEALGHQPLVPPGRPAAAELNRSVGFAVTVPEADTGTDGDPGPDSDAGADGDPGPDSDAGADSDTGPDGDPGPDSDARAGEAAPSALEASRVRFEPGASTLDADGEAVLRGLVEVLQAHPGWSVAVQGRAAASDAPLARDRAAAVRGYLVDRGVPGERLAARVALGEPGARASLALVDGEPGDLPPVVYFEAGDSQPVAASEPLLAEIAQVLHTRPALRLRLLGHSTPREIGGDDPMLARLRAQAVARALQQQGIAADRLEPVGLGSERPARLPAGVDAPSLHQRVVVVVLPPPLLSELRIPFAPGEARLASADEAIEQAAAALQRHPGVRVRVLGTAGVADGASGRSLAVQRASAVASALGLHGIGSGRLEPLGRVGTAQHGAVTFEVIGADEPRTVQFEAEAQRLDAEGRATVDAVARTLLALPDASVEVVGRAGHEVAGNDGEADARGDARDRSDPREALATARAEAVADGLVRAGVPAEAIGTRTEVLDDEGAVTGFEVQVRPIRTP